MVLVGPRNGRRERHAGARINRNPAGQRSPPIAANEASRRRAAREAGVVDMRGANVPNEARLAPNPDLERLQGEVVNLRDLAGLQQRVHALSVEREQLEECRLGSAREYNCGYLPQTTRGPVPQPRVVR
jgi:hypothetical protein